jgi:hypothetical protein
MKEIKPGKLSLPFGISPGRQGLRPRGPDNILICGDQRDQRQKKS